MGAKLDEFKIPFSIKHIQLSNKTSDTLWNNVHFAINKITRHEILVPNLKRVRGCAIGHINIIAFRVRVKRSKVRVMVRFKYGNQIKLNRKIP